MAKRKDTKQCQTPTLPNSNKGKQVTTIGDIRQQIIKLTQKHDFMMGQKKNSTTRIVDLVPVYNKICDNDSDVVVAQEQTFPEMNQREVADFTIDKESYNNNEKLTEQALMLPRQFCPIYLKNDRIL